MSWEVVSRARSAGSAASRPICRHRARYAGRSRRLMRPSSNNPGSAGGVGAVDARRTVPRSMRHSSPLRLSAAQACSRSPRLRRNCPASAPACTSTCSGSSAPGALPKGSGRPLATPIRFESARTRQRGPPASVAGRNVSSALHSALPASWASSLAPAASSACRTSTSPRPKIASAVTPVSRRSATPRLTGPPSHCPVRVEGCRWPAVKASVPRSASIGGKPATARSCAPSSTAVTRVRSRGWRTSMSTSSSVSPRRSTSCSPEA